MTQICRRKSIVDFALHHLLFSNWFATHLEEKSDSSTAAQEKEQKEKEKKKSN